MSRVYQMVTLGLVLIDGLLGTLLVVWPGAFQEWVHPDAIGTVFYPLQSTGAIYLARALLGVMIISRRPVWGRTALGAAWLVDGPAGLLLAWRTATTGPLALWVHGIHGAIALAFGLWAINGERDWAGKTGEKE